MDSEALFSLCYFIFSFGMVFPIQVFQQCGLSIESLFSKWLGSEEESFVIYHLRRTVATVLFHSSLPLGYILGRLYINLNLIYNTSLLWQAYFVGSLTLNFISVLCMLNWIRNDWKNHPVYSKLALFSAQGNYHQVANAINLESKGPLKRVLTCELTTKILITANWIVKTSPYTIDVAHQSDVSLEVVSSDEHQIVPDAPGGAQYLQIQVTSSRPQVKPFFLRINASDFQHLQNAVDRPIKVLENIRINQSLTDRFLVAFREQVQKNPRIDVAQQVEDDCWGCSVKKPNVKLMRTCTEEDTAEACKDCFCRAMWCLDCMGTWFASRQDPERPDVWMSSKCPCPICRSSFCVLDVCLIRETNDTLEPRAM